MIFWKKARKELGRRLTVLLIPHNSIRPLRITFSIPFLLLLFACWSGFTIWSGYLASRHIDYWRMQADQKLLRLKLIFFAEQMKKSQEMLEQVRENDEHIRTLLDMKSKKAIIDNDGKGGPTPGDVNDLNRLLTGKIYEISQQEIQKHSITLQQEAKERIDSFKEVMANVQRQRILFRATPSIWPCLGHITSTFGFRIHPIYHENDFHAGLDIASMQGTPIHATADGTIRLSEWQPGYGKLIIVDHGFGYRTYYGHLSKILVKNGERIKRGQLIGRMGSTGTSTGSHLHYEIQYSGSPVNPVKFLKKIYPGGIKS